MPDLPELFVLRHGETVWNREGRFQGIYDSPLTTRGMEQARGMGAQLAAQGVTGSSHDFVSSPQGRAMATAALAFAGLGAEARPDPLLREISMGEWNGLLKSQVDERWPGPEGESVLDFYARAPGGESFTDLWERVGAFLEGLRRPTVAVTHGLASRFLRTRAMGLGMEDLDRVPDGQGVIFCIRKGTHLQL